MNDFDGLFQQWCADSLGVEISEIEYATNEVQSWESCPTCGPETELVISVGLTNDREAELTLRFTDISTVLKGEPIKDGWERKRVGWV